jgi:hypothetical protein
MAIKGQWWAILIDGLGWLYYFRGFAGFQFSSVCFEQSKSSMVTFLSFGIGAECMQESR